MQSHATCCVHLWPRGALTALIGQLSGSGTESFPYGSYTQGSESDLIALLRALERHAEAKAQGGNGAAASLARRGHLNAPTLGMIWDICGQVARELKGMGLPAPYDW